MNTRKFPPRHRRLRKPLIKQSGMTLIEVLVAITLLAILASLAYRGLDQLQRQSGQLLADSRQWQDLAASFQRLETDLAQAVDRPVRTGADRATPPSTDANLAVTSTDTRMPAFLGLSQAATQPEAKLSPVQSAAIPTGNTTAADSTPTLPYLEFSRKSAPAQDELRLAYRLHGQTLELLLWPALDREGPGEVTIYPLLEQVRRLEFRYLDADGQWQSSWPVAAERNKIAPMQPRQTNVLPRAVELQLELTDGRQLRRVFALPT